MFGKRDKPKIDAASEFKCSWCADEILEDEECFAVGAKASADMDLQALEGTVVEMFLARRDRHVRGLVVTSDSPAKREGKDIVFVTCSESCSEALKQAVDREIELVD
jgi:hypothetical protein